MRKFPNRIAKIVHDSGLKLNTICKSSGISHTYLTKLMHGNVNQPGKDKIASILLALNYTIGEINMVLAVYDYQPLSRPDIPGILKNNAKRKVEGIIGACYDKIYLDMLLATMAKVGGTKIIVKNRPSALFMSDELYLKNDYPFSYEKDQRAEDFHHAFTLALLRERKRLFLENWKNGYRFETYICKNCLKEYLQLHLLKDDKLENIKHKQLIVQYFANALGVIQLSPDQHILKIVERCPYFHMQIQDADGPNPKINFPGRQSHVYHNETEQKNLEGFTTDSPQLVAIFLNEVHLCRKSAIQQIESDYPHKLTNYIVDLFKTFGLDSELSAGIQAFVTPKNVSL